MGIIKDGVPFLKLARGPPCLASVGVDTPNPIGTCCPGERGGGLRWGENTLSEEKGREEWDEELLEAGLGRGQHLEYKQIKYFNKKTKKEPKLQYYVLLLWKLLLQIV